MMNKVRFLQKIGGTLLMLLLFAACSQDESLPTGTLLPEGKYPLELTAGGLEVAATPAKASTRATVDNDWQDVQSVAVQVENEVKEYSVTPSSNNLTSTTPFYWQRSDETKQITAWHPYSTTYPTEWKVKADQSQKAGGYQASDLIKGSLSLSFADKDNAEKNKIAFTHQTAKLHIVLQAGKGISADELANATVSILNVANVDNGTTVTPCKIDGDFFALITGQEIAKGTQFIKVTVNGADFFYTPDKDTSFTGGNQYTYNITVNRTGLLVSVSEIKKWETGNTGEGSVSFINLSDGQPVNISDDGTYLITGTGTQTISISGNATVNIQNVKLTNVQGSVMTLEENAHVTLNVIGQENEFVSATAHGIEMKDGSQLTIIGNGKENSKLVVKASQADRDISTPNYCGIGATSESKDVALKGIIIKDVSVDVTGGKSYLGTGAGAAAIGLSSYNTDYTQKLDEIRIENASVTATSTLGACIGTGTLPYTTKTDATNIIGNIIITKSIIKAIARYDSSKYSGACIGFGVMIQQDNKATIGSITITDCNLDLTAQGKGAYKVGFGSNDYNNALCTITNGISVNGTAATVGWNSDQDYK